MKIRKRIAVLLVNHPKILKLAIAGILLVVAATVGVAPTGERDDEDELLW
ncbi:MAG: hypothetical protein GSR72_00510 [Desulfurococcales archaeon]|nr:hypothetical protein [Desulfurococcales archaeon]MEB3788359.1 hypothetical protein [Desulfurococcales archaeon]